MSTIIKYCNCLPYYYGKYVQRENVQICNFTQIKCLIDNYCMLYPPPHSCFLGTKVLIKFRMGFLRANPWASQELRIKL